MVGGVGSVIMVEGGLVDRVGVEEGTLVDVFTNRRFFIFINAIFFLVVISKVLFVLTGGRGMTDMGLMVRVGSIC